MNEGIPLFHTNYAINPETFLFDTAKKDAVENSDDSTATHASILYEETLKQAALVRAFFQMSRELKQENLLKITFQPQMEAVSNSSKRFSFVPGTNTCNFQNESLNRNNEVSHMCLDSNEQDGVVTCILFTECVKKRMIEQYNIYYYTI